MIIDSIREYMMGCPYLTDGSVNINCLGEKSACYSIDNVGVDSVIKRYCDGGTLRQFVFVLALRDVYDENVSENLRISGMFEQIENWILQQNKENMLPQIADKHIEPQSIEVIKSGYLLESHKQDGRWQMEIRMIYRQKY